MIKTLKLPYKWRHEMTNKTAISQDDEAKLINVLALDSNFQNTRGSILIFQPDNPTTLAVKNGEYADYQLYESLEELSVSEYSSDIYQSIFYGVLTLCYCMKLFSAAEAIAMADIFKEQIARFTENNQETKHIAEINRFSLYLMRKIDRKTSPENVDWSLAEQPITYEIKTRYYLTNDQTMLEK